ncbi:MAG: DUF6754 domain-containing protein [Candidatus Promineifilaceae bacterium]|nr:DUF6754 domain-containing protein [Candidatus Promineifilaceae bacterium]
MVANGLPLLGLLLVLALALFWLTRRARRQAPSVREPRGSRQAQRHVFAAVERGHGVHLTLGRGGLAAAANPVSLAALAAGDALAVPASAADVAPLVTVGAGTLLPAGQDALWRAYRRSGRLVEYKPGLVQFLADSNHPEAYAAGISYLLARQRGGTSLALGRFGAEVALMTEAARRQRIAQIVGSDDLLGLAAALPGSSGVLVGEELFAAGAILHERPAQLASLQLQDALRLVAIVGLIAAAVIAFVLGG